MRFRTLYLAVRSALGLGFNEPSAPISSSSQSVVQMMNIAYENWLSYFAEHCHIPESLWGTDGVIMARPRYGKSVPYLKGIEYGFYVPPLSEWGDLC